MKESLFLFHNDFHNFSSVNNREQNSYNIIKFM